MNQVDKILKAKGSETVSARSTSAVSDVVPELMDIYVDFRMMDWYRFLHDMYYGEGGVSGQTGQSCNTTVLKKWNKHKIARDVYSYLTPNPTENFYKTRVKISPYINYFRRYIDKKYEAVFKIPPATTVTSSSGTSLGDDHPYHDFLKDVNGGGMSKNEFYQSMFASTFRDEVSFLVMDKKEGRTEPYVYLQPAYSVEDYLTDDMGNLDSITFINQKSDGTFIKNMWSQNSLEVWTSPDGKKWTFSKSREIDRMPIKPVFGSARIDPDNYLPKPKSYPIASLNLSIYESWSGAMWIADKQGHDTIYVVGEVEAKRNALTNIWQIGNVGESASAGILSPDSSKIAAHLSLIEQKTSELFELMLDGGVLVTRNGNSPESGYAKMFTFSPVNDALLNTTKIAKDVDQWLVEMYQYYQGGVGGFDAITHYRNDYTPVTRATLLELREVLIIMEERGLQENAKAILDKMIMLINSNEAQAVKDLVEEVSNTYRVPTGGEA